MILVGINPVAIIVFHHLIGYLVEETQEVVLNAAVKARLAAACNITTRNLAVQLDKLVTSGVINKVATNIYTFNEELYK